MSFCLSATGVLSRIILAHYSNIAQASGAFFIRKLRRRYCVLFQNNSFFGKRVGLAFNDRGFVLVTGRGLDLALSLRERSGNNWGGLSSAERLLSRDGSRASPAPIRGNVLKESDSAPMEIARVMKKTKVATLFVVLAALALSALLFARRSDDDSTDWTAKTSVPPSEARVPESKKVDKKMETRGDDSSLRAAAQSLGRATDDFVGAFSDDASEDSNDERSEFDASLVDDETKRKYSEDRALIAPTLSERSEPSSAAPKYRLEYKFSPDSNLAWNVSHLVRKRVSYGGVEKLIETSSTTWRRWEFQEATPDGKIKARHWIDRMILRQNEEGKEPIDYDSERDVVVPKEIAAFGTEKAVGVVLETFAISPLGVMSDKKKLVAEYQGREGDSSVMVPFPDEELEVGDVWTIPYALYLKGGDGVPRPCRIVERFRLDKIDDRFATISFKTTLVSIVDDPVVEGALAERLFTGSVLFDRQLGQALRTELNFKKSVPGAFGFASFLEYNCQVVEKLDKEKSGLIDDPAVDASKSADPVSQE